MTFGPSGGKLITTDEYSGHIYAVGAIGHSALVADPGLPSGEDTGTENTGFVSPGFGAGWSAHVADARQPQPHPGDDSILALDGAALLAEGVRPGDLLVAVRGRRADGRDPLRGDLLGAAGGDRRRAAQALSGARSVSTS
jgi:hypothetical protein